MSFWLCFLHVIGTKIWLPRTWKSQSPPQIFIILSSSFIVSSFYTIFFGMLSPLPFIVLFFRAVIWGCWWIFHCKEMLQSSLMVLEFFKDIGFLNFTEITLSRFQIRRFLFLLFTDLFFIEIFRLFSSSKEIWEVFAQLFGFISTTDFWNILCLWERSLINLLVDSLIFFLVLCLLEFQFNDDIK